MMWHDFQEVYNVLVWYASCVNLRSDDRISLLKAIDIDKVEHLLQYMFIFLQKHFTAVYCVQ